MRGSTKDLSYRVSFKDLLNGNVLYEHENNDLSDEYYLIIYDDRSVINSDDIDKIVSEINRGFPNKFEVCFSNLLVDSYYSLLNSQEWKI